MTEPNEFRRQQDWMLHKILEDQAELLKTLSDFREEHAGLHGRLETRLDAVQRTAEALEITVDRHESWINTSKGQTSVIAAIFGAIGAALTFIVDHYLIHH